MRNDLNQGALKHAVMQVALLNFAWLGLLRRPAIAALLSLAMVITLIVL